jgi:hypothetical protein
VIVVAASFCMCSGDSGGSVILSMCSGEIVALKKLKMEKEKEGFPITSLREINMPNTQILFT